MSLFRLIARLDLKGENVVKGIQFEGLRIVGKPEELAERYAQEVDELLYLDTVASLYGRGQLESLLERTVDRVFVPVTVGGGIRSVEDMRRLLRAGADKVAVNTAALKRPELVREMADSCGRQAVVVSIEAKRRPAGGWEAYCDNGRQATGCDVRAWATQAVDLGAGELLVTSVDKEGTRRGFDVDLIRMIAPEVPVPVTAAGGCGNPSHLQDVVQRGKADAVAVASVLHFGKHTVTELRGAVLMTKRGLPV